MASLCIRPAHFSRTFMRKYRLISISFIGFCFTERAPAATMDFWNRQERGANYFNQNQSLETLRAGKEFGLRFVRLTGAKWKRADKDFLVGNVDQYQSIPDEDLKALRSVLDDAENSG